MTEKRRNPRPALPPGLERLVQRLDHSATLSDLPVPPAQREALRAIVLRARRPAAAAKPRALADSGQGPDNVTALFTGADSAGRTMTAAALATELGVDLYRVDLGQVVSKYVGETEKNLRSLFAAAQRAGAVLFFDEADALFGKRTEVKDAHDRYADIEISYLLERLETHEGLVILATNRKESLDDAFTRRIRYVVDLESPPKLGSD